MMFPQCQYTSIAAATTSDVSN